jgi:sulfate-transporting ATPase
MQVGEGAEEVELGVAGRSIPVRAYCSLFNFKGADQTKLVGNLSGGERSRLQLAKVSFPRIWPYVVVAVTFLK